MQLKCTEVRIETTRKCNARCTICTQSLVRRFKAQMDQAHAEYLIDQAKLLGAELISLFGFGEPLLDSMLEDKVRYCTRAGLDTFITTNASRLYEDRARRLLNYGLTNIRFSVHGLKNTYEKVHKRLSWEETSKNIFDFIKINREEHDNYCQTSVTVIPMHGETIDELREFWEPHVGFLEVWRPHNWTTGKKFRGIKEERKITCGRPHNGPIQVLANGDVIVCCFDYEGRMVVGNTYTTPLEAIIKGEAFNRIRKAHEGPIKEGLLCASCDQLQDEEESPLLYSSRDRTCEVGKTSSTKYRLV